jgi:hypothetical protein
MTSSDQFHGTTRIAAFLTIWQPLYRQSAIRLVLVGFQLGVVSPTSTHGPTYIAVSNGVAKVSNFVHFKTEACRRIIHGMLRKVIALLQIDNIHISGGLDRYKYKSPSPEALID